MLLPLLPSWKKPSLLNKDSPKSFYQTFTPYTNTHTDCHLQTAWFHSWKLCVGRLKYVVTEHPVLWPPHHIPNTCRWTCCKIPMEKIQFTVKRLYFAGRIFRKLASICEICFERKLCQHHMPVYFIRVICTSSTQMGLYKYFESSQCIPKSKRSSLGWYAVGRFLQLFAKSRTCSTRYRTKQ